MIDLKTRIKTIPRNELKKYAEACTTLSALMPDEVVTKTFSEITSDLMTRLIEHPDDEDAARFLNYAAKISITNVEEQRQFLIEVLGKIIDELEAEE